MKKQIGVIGGGAAGMMAAITAAREGAKVTIFECREEDITDRKRKVQSGQPGTFCGMLSRH